MNNYPELLQDAASYGFDTTAIKQAIIDGKITQLEARDILEEEIYGDGGHSRLLIHRPFGGFFIGRQTSRFARINFPFRQD